MMPRRSRAPLALLAALGLLLGLAVAALLGAPRIVEVSPAPGSERVPAGAPVRVTFSRPMDRPSAEAHFEVEPAISGAFAWEGETLVFTPEGRWPAGAQVRVRVRAGARSTRLLPLLRSREWTFTVGEPRVLYLWPSDGPADLYARAPGQEEPDRLTETPLGVVDYSVGAGGSRVAYTRLREDGSTDLRLLDLATGEDRLVFACPEGERCQAPALSLDGRWLAFERAPLEVGRAGQPVPGRSSVWALAVDEGSGPVRIGPADHVTGQPAWSPRGWLAYYDGTLRTIAVVDATAGAEPPALAFIPSDLGNLGSWSPDGIFLVFPEIVFAEEPVREEGDEEGTIPFFSHLYRVEVSTGLMTDLSGENQLQVEDASPVYSPDGRWIAFARKYLDSARWTPGRQLWVMRFDGSDARPLTDAPAYNHSAPAWSPDSTILVYMRLNTVDFGAPPEIWWTEVESGESGRLAIGGFLPQWIP